MIHFPFALLPDDFTHLLKVNMQSSSKNFLELKQYFMTKPDMTFLLKNCFQDIDEAGNVDRIMKAVGWFGMRDRLANIYLHRLEHGVFPKAPPENECADILLFEDEFKRFTVDGYSRLFLLAFYLKFTLKDQKIKTHFREVITADEMMKCFVSGKSRIIKIDWMVVILSHFVSFFGIELCLTHLKNGNSFSELWKQLEEKQQRILTANLLSYGAAINEPDIFISDLIQ